MPPEATVEVPVHEIRDYQRVNLEVAALLDRGRARLRLAGVSRHRLLLAGLRGGWHAAIEIDGPAGPELAAGLDAPGLIVVAAQGALDGAGSGLNAGHLVLTGGVGDALAYRQSGGIVVATGLIGHRAGLEMRGGLLVLGGPAGRLVGERQRGGQIVALTAEIGPHAGHGRSGGQFPRPGEAGATDAGSWLADALEALRPYLPADLVRRLST